MSEHHGIWSGQLSIAPRYHADILDEAQKTGRTVVNIMADRVEDYPSLLATNEALRDALEKIADYSPASTIQPVQIARTTLKAASTEETQDG